RHLCSSRKSSNASHEPGHAMAKRQRVPPNTASDRGLQAKGNYKQRAEEGKESPNFNGLVQPCIASTLRARQPSLKFQPPSRAPVEAMPVSLGVVGLLFNSPRNLAG